MITSAFQLGLEQDEKRARRAAMFPFEDRDDRGRGVRHGFAIVVPDGRAGWKVWGIEIFVDECTANVTAARCVGGECQILPARQIIHLTGSVKNPNYRRTILVDWNSMEKTA
jgi:hypothetical protein